MKARIKRLDSTIELPKYHTAESAGFDIAANADMIIGPGQVVKMPTGLIIEAPEGYFLHLAARGSLGIKKGLLMANSVGIVDRDYAGPNDEIFLPLYNFTANPVEVKRGERIAQGIFMPVNQVEWEEVDALRDVDRGGGGSTGGYADNSKE